MDRELPEDRLSHLSLSALAGRAVPSTEEILDKYGFRERSEGGVGVRRRGQTGEELGTSGPWDCW